MKPKHLLVLGGLFLLFVSLETCKKKTSTTEETTVAVPTGLKGAFANYFKIGVAAGNSNIETADENEMMAREFNSFTPDNALKWKYIHPKYTDGNPASDYSFTKMDAIVDYALSKGMVIRGHVLIWHVVDNLPLYMGKDYSWVTRTPENAYLEREEFFKRMKIHITTVMNHYKGKIFAYDVVNEAAADSTNQGDTVKQYSDMYRIAAQTKHRGISFIDSAFKYAHEADPNAKLYYNDNRFEDPGKRARIHALLRHLLDNKSKGVHIDGIGMQAHWWPDDPSAEKLDATIAAFLDLGLKIHITELDVSVYNEYDKTKPADLTFNTARETRQIEQYRTFFNVFKKYKSVVESVTFWNVSDRYTWRTDYPVDNRTDYPLLFDKNLKPKKAYTAVVNDLK